MEIPDLLKDKLNHRSSKALKGVCSFKYQI